MRRIPGHPWSSPRVRRGETPTWDLLSIRPLFSHTHLPAVHMRFLWCGWSSVSLRDLSSQPCPVAKAQIAAPQQWVTAAAEELGLGQLAATAEVSGAQFCSGRSWSIWQHPGTWKYISYLKMWTIFFSINSDTFHMLILGSSSTAQIRMVLGAETYIFSSCYYFLYFSSRHTRTNFLKELLQLPFVAGKFVATHSVWKHGLFMSLTKYLKYPLNQPKVLSKLPT